MRPSQVSESEVFRTETCENRKNTAHVSNMSPVFPEGSDLLFSTEVSDSSTHVYVCRLKALQCVYFFLGIIFFSGSKTSQLSLETRRIAENNI